MTTPAVMLSYSTVEVKRWSTAGLLGRALTAIWVLDVLVLLAFFYCFRVHSEGLNTIGVKTVPSIIAARQIKTSLADMDADAANELLADPASSAADLQAFNARREEAADALIEAAKNIGYSEELRPIRVIELSLGKYEALIQQARDQRSDGRGNYVATYAAAADLMDNTILAAANALDKVNLDNLENAYGRERSEAIQARFVVGLSVVALVGLLIAVQVYIFKRTNRLFNLPLLAATLLLIGFSDYAFKDLHAVGENLRSAKEDAFAAMNTLLRASAAAYSANADESRFLLEADASDKWSQEFANKRDLIAMLPGGENWEQAAQASSPSALTGYLADELSNITSPGERDAAEETLRDFARYVVIDGQIRALEQQGKTKEAVALCMGTAAGQSDWAFQQFSAALHRTFRINQEHFDALTSAGLRRLKLFTAKASVAAALTAILCLWGLMQRIGEYK